MQKINSKWERSFAFLVIMMLCILFGFLSRGASAQVAGGTISGSVTDPSGAGVPNAQVTITNSSTSVVTNSTTNKDGFYNAPNLLPSVYVVAVSASGFSISTASNITLTVGAQLTVNIVMQIGDIQQKIEVTGAALAVDLVSSSVSGLVTQTAVVELPLNGRDWTSLATLQPGVTSVPDQQSATAAGSPRANRGFGNQMTVSGQRPQENAYRVDGISVNDYSNGGPGSVLGGNLGVDAIQEFSVITSNFDATYGRAAGGVINSITRSGTDNFHGDVYEFLRNSAVDAKSFFDTNKPEFRRNQFGTSAGGPIQKGKTFVFGDYEGVRQFLGITQVDTVPSDAARATAAASVVPFLALYPHATNTPAGSQTGKFDFVSNQIVTENFVTARVDHTFSSKDSLFGTYLFDNSYFSQPDALDTTLIDSKVRRQVIALQESHVFSPAFLNAARFGFSRQAVIGNENPVGINAAASDPTLGFVPGRNVGFLVVPGLTQYSGGVGSANAPHFDWNSFQFYDDAYLTRGIHSLKFGIAVERMQLNERYTSRPNGQFNFASLAAFLAGDPRSVKADLPFALTPRYIRQTLIAPYFQDDIRVRKDLTLNVGLRYEVSTVPTETQGEMAVLTSPTAAQPRIGSPYFQNPTVRDFSPRVGLAWDPFGNGKTSVRAAFGLYDNLPLPYQFELTFPLAAPFFEQASVTSGLTAASFPTGWFAPAAANLKNLRTVYIEQNPPRSYVMQWTLNVQRQITSNLTAMASYVGTRGVHMPFRTDDINEVMPTLTPQGYLWPASGAKLNPNVGQITGALWSSNTSYNGLQVRVVRQFTHGFQAQASYTFSKCIDEGSASLVSDAYANSPTGLPWFDPKARRGLCDFDIRNVVVGNFTWVIPSVRSNSAILGWAGSGWQFGGILTAQNGTPFTVTLGGDPLGQNSTAPYDVPDVVNGPGCQTLVNPGSAQYLKLQCFAFPSNPHLLGNLGRNQLIGPGFVDLDFSFYKNNYIKRISESANLQFRAELFNVLNHPNFLSPLDNSVLFNQSGAPVAFAGQIDAVTNPGRQIQFALKFMW